MAAVAEAPGADAAGGPSGEAEGADAAAAEKELASPEAVVASGSAVSAARLLLVQRGRRVRSRTSGTLGIVVDGVDIVDAGECDASFGGASSSTADPAAEAASAGGDGAKDEGHFWVRAPGARAPLQRRPADDLEPWTRGVRVRTIDPEGACDGAGAVDRPHLEGGQLGEVVRVLQDEAAVKRPYLVRFEDGSERWLGPAELRFEPLRRAGTSLAGEAACAEAERCEATLVPGRWLLRLPGDPKPRAVTLSVDPGGAVRGSGEGAVGAFVVEGEERGGRFEARLLYTGVGATRRLDLAASEGAWAIHGDTTAGARWAVVDPAGHAEIAGAEAGVFHACGRHLHFVSRLDGSTQRVLPGACGETLHWDDGSLWRRLACDPGATSTEAAEPRAEALKFEPEVISDKGDGRMGTCKVSAVEPAESRALRVLFKASSQGPLPDPLKTELKIDNRVVEAARAKFASVVSKSKRKKNEIKGELLFDDVVLRLGSGVSFRFGGEFAGYEWLDLVEPMPCISALAEGSISWEEQPFRPRLLEGTVAEDGCAVSGTSRDEPGVSVTGKTAEGIKISRTGKSTMTVSRRPYEDEDFAVIKVRGPAVVRFSFFQTEPSYDCLSIAGVEYSGDELPPPFFIPEGAETVMTWKTDEATTDEGWEFEATFGIAQMRLPQREVDFGARRAHWNPPDADGSFSGRLVHLDGNAFGGEAFRASDVGGNVVLICAEDTDDSACSGEEEAQPSDAALFDGPLFEPLRRAQEAGARAAVVALPAQAAAPASGALRLTPTMVEAEEDSAVRLPSVIIGHELGLELLRLLAAGVEVELGDFAQPFAMSLHRPAPLDASADLCRLCLGNASALDAVLFAELSLCFPCQASGGRHRLWSVSQVATLAEHIRKCLGAPELAEGSVWEFLTARHAPDGEMEWEQIEECCRELIRRFMPMALPAEAVVPRGDAGSIWQFYHKRQRLGSGAFGVVREGWDRFVGVHVAIKKVKLRATEHGEMSRDDVMKEFSVLRDLSHPNLLRVVDIFDCADKIYIVTELAADGDLTSFVASPGKLDERWIAAVVRQVLSACGSLHRRKIVHHDIKPANVLVTTHRLPAPEAHVPYVLVADVGLAQPERFVAGEALKQSGAHNGTEWYMAPESAKGLSGPKTDVYAIGITLFELLSGGEGPDPVNEEGEVGEVDWTSLQHCSDDAVSSARALMAPDVGMRPSCQEALAAAWWWPHGLEDAGPSSSPPEAVAATRRVATERLREYRGADFLQRACRNLLVGQLGREDLQGACQAFECMDIDRDGAISEDDLIHCMRQCGRDRLAAIDAMRAADVHGRGYVEFREFAAAFLRFADLPAGRLSGATEKLFVQFGGAPRGAAGVGAGGDRRSGGGVELGALLERFGYRTEAEAESLAAEFRRRDRRGIGQLSREDFFAILGSEAPSPWWAPVAMPEAPPALVDVLRGSSKDACIERGHVRAWKFVTFGQRELAKSSGRWYYELLVRKSDYPQVGWADRRFEIDPSLCDDGVGDDEFSWGVDGVRGAKWHNGLENYDLEWPRPVVVGCALDLDSTPRTIQFSVDGRWPETPEFQDITFEGGVYPAASGILVAEFRFHASTCTHAPPDGSFQHLLGQSSG